jgi:hypothetical protein
MGWVASTGFLWDAGDAKSGAGEDAGGGASAGAESQGGADDDRPGGVLGEALSAGEEGADATVSEASVAGETIDCGVVDGGEVVGDGMAKVVEMQPGAGGTSDAAFWSSNAC